jgi:hypothetical protein
MGYSHPAISVSHVRIGLSPFWMHPAPAPGRQSQVAGPAGLSPPHPGGLRREGHPLWTNAGTLSINRYKSRTQYPRLNAVENGQAPAEPGKADRRGGDARDPAAGISPVISVRGNVRARRPGLHRARGRLRNTNPSGVRHSWPGPGKIRHRRPLVIHRSSGYAPGNGSTAAQCSVASGPGPHEERGHGAGNRAAQVRRPLRHPRMKTQGLETAKHQGRR